ncbi:transcriptional regulator [Mergibacter septicus]|uniref:helix-turn-helix domain-containing protein n=1 Tax=Mergibacter septicus TaxID=221402 RepID=UPI0011792E77|nr:helix-turn-helix transcriptional regulator [Mergibacter septicus]AWX14562.1 transcriptional regulator [Mergibacter septicus]
MAISYKPLWHLMVEKNIKKKDLKSLANISANCIARMSKEQYVNLETIEKICIALDCRIEDICEIAKE